MKRKKILLIIVPFIITACPYPGYYETEAYTPIYVSRETLDNSVKYINEARNMEQTGKIYYRAPYIFVNERYKGVHLINNEDPYNPVVEGFILAPGCIDMAVKGNIMYLDNAVDLVSFDLISKEVTSRIRNVFPEPLPPDDFFSYRNDERPKGYIIVRWEKTINTYRNYE